MQLHQAMSAPRKVVRTRFQVVDGVRWAYADDLECRHIYRYHRRQRGATAKVRDCLQCRDAKPAGASTAGDGPAPPPGSAALVTRLRIALRRLLADPGARAQAYDALGTKDLGEAATRGEVLEELAQTVVRSLQVHPFGPAAMELRDEQDRLCRLGGLIPAGDADPEAPGEARRVALPGGRGS